MKTFLQKYLPWGLVIVLLIIIIFFRSCSCSNSSVDNDRNRNNNNKQNKPVKNVTKTSTASYEVKSIGKKDLYTIERFGAGTFICAGKDGEIFITHNGGLNWKQSNVGFDVYSSAALSYDIFLVCGKGGKIFRTVDNGATWNSVTSGITKNIRSMYFVNENDGYAAGDSGLVLKTNNGGLNWSSVTNPNLFTINSVCFTDVNTGWFACNGGMLLKTNNAGVSIDTQSIGTSKNLLSISFNNKNRGTVVGDSGIIYITKNGGVNWTASVAPVNKNLRGVHRISNNLAYIVGDGVILRENTDSLSVLLSDNSKTWYAVDPAPYISGIVVGSNGTMCNVNTIPCNNCENQGNHDLLFIPPDEGETNWKLRVRVYQESGYKFKNYFRFILPGFELDNNAISGWTQLDGVGIEPVNIEDINANTSTNTDTRYYKKTVAGSNSGSGNQYVDALTLEVNSINSSYMYFNIRPNNGNSDSTGSLEFYFGECPTGGLSENSLNQCDLNNMDDMNFCHKITYQLSLKK
jgi:photosystem II stability/assembly factor-like uncharacterized protein